MPVSPERVRSRSTQPIRPSPSRTFARRWITIRFASGAGHTIKLADVRIGSMFEQPSSETINRLQADLDDAKRNHGLASSHAKVLNERARMLTSFAEAAASRLAKTASQPETLSSLVQIGDSVEADRMALATRQQAADEALELATRQVAFAQDALDAATGGGGYRTQIALTFDRADRPSRGPDGVRSGRVVHRLRRSLATGSRCHPQ